MISSAVKVSELPDAQTVGQQQFSLCDRITPMRIFLVRHASTSASEAGVYNSYTDRPLSELGAAQARDLATSYRSLKNAPEKILTSPQMRAKSTAIELASAFGAKLEVDSRLMEVDLGEIEGLTRAQVREGLAAKQYRQWKSGVESSASDMESMDSALSRVLAVLEDLIAGGEDVVIVSHGILLRALVLSRVFSVNPNKFESMSWDSGCVTLLEYDENYELLRLKYHNKHSF